MLGLKTVRPPGPLTAAVQFLHSHSSKCARTLLASAASFRVWNSTHHAEDLIPDLPSSKISLLTSALLVQWIVVILLSAVFPVRGPWLCNEVCDMSYTVQYLESEMASQGIEVSVLVNCLVQDAIHLNASDLHIEPWENAIAVRARVNGVLTEIAHLPLDLMEKISMRFKVMSNLVTYQAGTPQDGTAIGGPELDGVQLRVSIFPTTRGEKIVVRLFDPRDKRFELNSLGFEESTRQGLLRTLKRTSGLLLFTGPTGSGKTSTMYSALCYIMQRDGTSVSISTVEDPVEFNLPMVSQTQISPAQEFT